MKHTSDTTWKEDLYFDTNVAGHSVEVEASTNFGGKDRGVIPKPLILSALGGCTAMDVMSILTKMKQDVTYFNVKVDGELEDEEPHPYKSMHLTYEVGGNDISIDKVEKAVGLSMDKYCGVAALLKKAIPVTWEIVIK